MDTLDEQRRRRFMTWFDLEFARVAPRRRRAALQSRLSLMGASIGKSRLSQLFNPDQPFGEAAALNLARGLCLPDDVFLTDLALDQHLNRGLAQEVSAPLTYAARPVERRGVPVIGAVRMSGTGSFADEEIVPLGGFVLSGSSAANAYAIRVNGDALYPAVRHGSHLVIEPHGECVPGELVLMKLRDGRNLLRELHREAGDVVTVLSPLGTGRETLDRSSIEWMHPVADIVSASRWIAPENTKP